MLKNIPRLNIAGIIISLILFFSVFEFVKRKKIKEEHALLWFGLCLVFLVLSIFPSILKSIANFFQIYYAPAVLFIILIIGIFILLLYFAMMISGLSENTKQLCQELALLKFQIQDSRKKKKGK